MGSAVRLDRWPVILADAIEDARDRPFVWGSHDCATWAFTVAFALRGEPAPEWIGSYTTKAGAAGVLKAHRIALEDVGTGILGPPLASPLLAWRGDVIWAEEAYGVCIGQDIAQVGPSGLVLRPLMSAVRAWRV